MSGACKRSSSSLVICPCWRFGNTLAGSCPSSSTYLVSLHFSTCCGRWGCISFKSWRLTWLVEKTLSSYLICCDSASSSGLSSLWMTISYTGDDLMRFFGKGTMNWTEYYSIGTGSRQCPLTWKCPAFRHTPPQYLRSPFYDSSLCFHWSMSAQSSQTWGPSSCSLPGSCC